MTTLEEHLRKPHRFVFLVQWCRVWLGPGPITRHDHDGLTQVCPGNGVRACVCGGGGGCGGACVHLIQVAEHLRVRLPASPPPGALDDEELFIIEG